MKAVLLVGGEGTRLRPLTCNLPKPMVNILNRPFLEHVIAYLREHGIQEIILALCYLPGQIQSHFGDGEDFGVRLTYVVEDSPLGTAGAVKNAERRLDGTFFVLNGDVYTDLDLSAMLAFHRERGARATISLTPVEDPTGYGVVETNVGGRARRFVEKPSREAATSNTINAGIYLLEPEVFGEVPFATNFSFERDLFPRLLERGDPIFGFPFSSYWIDMGTPEKYRQLHHDLLQGQISRPFPGRPIGGEVWVEEGCSIHPSSEMKGPLVIGQNCTIKEKARILGPSVIGAGCEIGSETSIEGAIIWENVRIGEKVTLGGCIVGNHTLIEDRAWALDSILGDNVVVREGSRLVQGTRVWPGKTLEPHAISF